ncbi:hypothetical protein [Streptomyces pristinaespiralis]|uniref:hypothetical protein n=1 Tax=Streptomyces pristinaespiralis TaxID=38300 RepID=UPI00340B12A7
MQDVKGFCFVVQMSHDGGSAWQPGPVHPTAGPEGATAAEVASEILDKEYRRLLAGTGAQPIPLLQVLVWNGLEPVGPFAASSATGRDHQWSATGALLEEIVNDIRHFEQEKQDAEAKAASAQRAITNAKARLESVARSAVRMKMPQVEIAHRTGRSREWVRRLTTPSA